MKNLFYLLSILLLAACHECKEPEPYSPYSEAIAHVRAEIEAFGNYDPYRVEEMIGDKLLSLSVRLEYNAEKTEVISVPYAFGRSDDGTQADRYLLRKDGSASYFYWSSGGWMRKDGQWSFDPERRTLQLFDISVEVISVGSYSIIWDKQTTDVPGGKPRSLEEGYIVETIDPNSPDPRPDTQFEEIDVLLLSTEQQWIGYYGEDHSSHGCFIYKMGSYYAVSTELVFWEDCACNFKENQIYVWAEDLEGKRIPVPSIQPHCPLGSVLISPEDLCGAAYPNYSFADDYMFSIYPAFVDMGEYFLRVKCYEPTSKKYYVSPDYKLTFSETDFGTYTKLN